MAQKAWSAHYDDGHCTAMPEWIFVAKPVVQSSRVCIVQSSPVQNVLPITGDMLFDPFWEVVHRLETFGFKVIAATADGASPNRAFLRIHFPSKKEHKTKNPFTLEDRHIHFFSDPPHLLKTIRNCMASSKRQLWVSS